MSQDDTLKIPSPPPDSGTTQRIPGRGEALTGETQPTQRVEVGPISETQPTVPVQPVFEQTAVSPPPGPPMVPPAAEPPPFIRRGAGWSLPPISIWTLLAVAGMAILFILAGLGLMLSAQRGAWALRPTATPTATVTPTLTPTWLPTPTVLPTLTPVPATPTPILPTDTPRPAPTRLEIGVLARVTPPQGYKLKVRAAAGVSGQLLGELDADTQVKIVEGPREADGLRWWKVDNGQGLVGWSAEGSGGETYLAPVGWAP